MSADRNTPRKSSRRGRTTALAESAAGVTRGIFDKRGLAGGVIARDWPQIVGPKLARHTCPEKIAYDPHKGTEGTLHLRIDSGSFAAELQHLTPLLLERINAYFGYRAVVRVHLIQGPLPKRPTPPAPPQERPLEREEEARLEALLETVEDEALRQRLRNLGRHVLGRR